MIINTLQVRLLVIPRFFKAFARIKLFNTLFSDKFDSFF